MSAAIRRAGDLLKRRGLLIVISDLYDEDSTLDVELRRAVRMGHEVAVFQVLTREEIEFPFTGDLEFEDLESAKTVITNADAVRLAYQRQMSDFLERWRTRCAGAGIDYSRVTTDQPLDAALRGYLLRRRSGAVR